MDNKERKYVVFRRDGYILITDEYWRAEYVISKYYRMEYGKRKRWLRQHGLVIEISELQRRMEYLIEKYCDGAVHGVMKINDAVRCVSKALDEMADNLLIELHHSIISKERLYRRSRHKILIQLVDIYNHPALRRAKTIHKKPLMLEFKSSIWVVISEYRAVSFSKEYINMIDSDPERAVQVATEFFEPGYWFREYFLKTDFSKCDHDVCRKMRELQVYLQVV